MAGQCRLASPASPGLQEGAVHQPERLLRQLLVWRGARGVQPGRPQLLPAHQSAHSLSPAASIAQLQDLFVLAAGCSCAVYCLQAHLQIFPERNLDHVVVLVTEI